MAALSMIFSSIMGQSILQKKVNAFTKVTNLASANISIDVKDLNSNKSLASFQSNKSLSPASSVKLFTTAIALDKLGEDYTFDTELRYSGMIEAGTLNGNLYIIGSGDPSLGSDQMDAGLRINALLEKMLQAIKAVGINKVNGHIVSDVSCFDSAVIPPSWPWIDLGNYYACGAHGLNLHENLYYLFFDQSPKIGATPDCCGTDPDIPNLTFINELETAGPNSGDNAYIYGAPYTYTKFIRGTIPAGNGSFKIKGSIPDPPLLMAQLLKKELEKSDIQISGSARTSFAKSPKGNSLFIHESPGLQDIVNRTNLKSVNLYAEILLKTLGKEFKQDGSFNQGLEFINEYLKNNGCDTKGLFLMDGSGLSPNTGVSASHFTQLLKVVFDKKKLYNNFKKSLPVSGQSGSMKRLLINTPAAGNLFVKSGSMERVRSYTGFASTQSGKTLGFSIIVNNYEGSSRPLIKEIEKLMLEIYKL